MASNPKNRLFTADTYYLELYNGTVAIGSLPNAGIRLANLLAIFNRCRVSLQVSEDDGSATYDSGYTPIPYRQRWTAEVGAVVDLVYDNTDSFYELVSAPGGVGIGPYWFLFSKGVGARGFWQKGTVSNLEELLSADGAQQQSITFSLWGIPTVV